MKTRKGYLPADSIYPLTGLNTLDPSPQADHHSSPNCLNISLIKGEISKRRGYVFIGTPFPDPVIGLVEFEDFENHKTLLAFTTKKQYKFDTGTEDWVDITYQVDDADVDWTGDLTNLLDSVQTSGNDADGTYTKWIIVTNGLDQPRYWDGSADTFALFNPSGISNFKSCKTLTGFYDHLILGNISYTSGEPNESLVIWSETQELTRFADVDNGTGAAILTDTQGEIQKFLELGDRLMIYSDNSVHGMTFVQGNIIFSFEKILQETRLVSARTVVNIGPFHVFLSQENVVYFDGTRLTFHLGNHIYRSYRDEFYASSRHLSFTFHDVALQHVYFNYPTAVDDSQMYLIEYILRNLDSSTWTRIKYTDNATCMGQFSRDSNLACNSAQFAGVPCSGTDLPCAQGSVKGGFPVRVFGTEDGKVALADETVPNDAGVAPDSYWDTVDFTVPESYQSELARWIELELDLKGFECDLYYSKDQGQTYILLKTLDLTSNYSKYRIPFDVMSRTIRFRLRNTCPSSTFYLRWLRVWLRAGGPS